MRPTIWISPTMYMALLKPFLSMICSQDKHPDILPIHGSEFMIALRVGGSQYSPAAGSRIPKRRRKDGRACRDPKEPVSLLRWCQKTR